MILVDFSQVMLSNLMRQLGNHLNAELNVDLLRHMVLNSLRSYRMKFSHQYGEMVICCDDKQSWRREKFPFYKANRKKARDASELDWVLIHESFAKIRAELKEFFPYRVVEVPRAEADDIIATLSRMTNTEKCLILSGDKDFTQLHHVNVEQYDPVLKKPIKNLTPAAFLREQIIRGDTGDGVPNFLSDDDTLVNSTKRQAKIYKVKVAEWINMKPEEFCTSEKLKKNYERNKSLIDLSLIPEDVVLQIIDRFNLQEGKGRDKLFNFFITYKLKNLIDSIGDF